VAHADDLGWANVGWHDVGQSLITSGPGQPHMKKLVAEESITLDRHYAYPYCSPTRASTLTGRLPYHVNQINIASYLPGAGVARNMTMIPVQSAAIAPD
jgi:arylsulfatase B